MLNGLISRIKAESASPFKKREREKRKTQRDRQTDREKRKTAGERERD